MTFKIRDMDERDLEPMAALMFYMWHDFYGGFMPQTFANERYPAKVCEERQMQLLLNCKKNPEKYKSLVAINEKGELLGNCYVAKYDATKRVAKGFEMPNFDTELHRIFVWPNARGHGLGSAFLKNFLPWFDDNDYKSCFAWSFEDNPYNRFYPKQGAMPHKTVKADYTGKKLSVTAYAWMDFIGAQS